MLILVGVTVSIMINSNLLGNAKTAAEATRTAYNREGNLENEGTVNGENLGNYMQNLINKIDGGETTGDEPSEFGPGKRASKNEEYTQGTKTAIIPEGFTLSGITEGNNSETTIDGGLVIYDIPSTVDTSDWTQSDWEEAKTEYNQFVWIPVEFTKAEGETYETANKNFDTVWVRSEWSNNARTTGLSTSYTEPHSTYDNKTTGTTGIEEELDEMKQSVYKYGGFYIARYEAGYVNSEGENTIRTSSSMPATTPIFVQDAYPYNNVAWGDDMGNVGESGAVYLSRNLYKNSSIVTSMLCSSVAWDAMLDFVKDSSHNVTNSTSWGNCYDSTYTTRPTSSYSTDYGSTFTKGSYNKESSGNVLLTTGASESFKSKNIYDIAGNCAEWTTEAYSSNYRVLRGRHL